MSTMVVVKVNSGSGQVELWQNSAETNVYNLDDNRKLYLRSSDYLKLNYTLTT